MQYVLILAIVGGALYLSSRLTERNLANVQRHLYHSLGALLVFGSAFLLTRNLGVAAIASLVFSLLVRNGYITFGTPAPAPVTGMSAAEAYRMFGLKPGASREEIQAAYWRIMKQNHPDQGGSTYLATKINEARNILLKNTRAV